MAVFVRVFVRIGLRDGAYQTVGGAVRLDFCISITLSTVTTGPSINHTQCTQKISIEN